MEFCIHQPQPDRVRGHPIVAFLHPSMIQDTEEEQSSVYELQSGQNGYVSLGELASAPSNLFAICPGF